MPVCPVLFLFPPFFMYFLKLNVTWGKVVDLIVYTYIYQDKSFRGFITREVFPQACFSNLFEYIYLKCRGSLE